LPAAKFTSAMLEQIDAFSSRGDAAGAMRIAQQSGIQNLDVATENYADLNNLGVIAEMGGDRAKADSFYERALRANPPATARTSIESNLARAKGAK
jgi:Flp pilus assembly protein TadD